jgi:hypothetical protein
MNLEIRYWFSRELQIYISRRTFALINYRRNKDGSCEVLKELLHFRIENLKGGGG